MAQQLFQVIENEDVSDNMLAEACQLFSDNYGIWGSHAAKPGESVKTKSFSVY